MPITPLTPDDAETKSLDLFQSNFDQLKELFPELVTEDENGKAINVDVLKGLVGDRTVTDAEEKYGLNWFGKRQARQFALTPSTGTLRPCPEDSVDWDTTQNLMIEGDNLEVLKLLQKSYTNSVRIIYIDPPYNTGNDFVYPDNYQDNTRNYLSIIGQIESGQNTSTNTEASGRFHTNWINMMYPRLRLARNLLSDQGLIFISIDQNESDNLRKVCNEVFGEENFRNEVVIRRGAKSVQAQFESWDKLGISYERILIYSKKTDYRFPKQLRSLDEPKAGSWNNHWRGTDRPTMRYELLGKNPASGQWRWGKERSNTAVENYQKMLHELGAIPETITQDQIDEYYLRKLNEGIDLDFVRMSLNGNPEHYVPPTDSTLLNDNWFDLPISSSQELLPLFENNKVFDNPKPTALIQRIMDFGDNNDLILDFFAGSGTTGHAVMVKNTVDKGSRKYILVQLPESLNPENNGQKVAADYCDKLQKPRNIAEITKERLRRAANKVGEENPLFPSDLGFRVFKLDSSNIQAWDAEKNDIPTTLQRSIEHLKTDRSEEDILYEVLLKLGLDLCIPIETRTIAGKTVYSTGGGVLMACLATSIKQEEVESLALEIVNWHKELNPTGDTTCIFRDDAFADDVAKTNLSAILNQYGIVNVRSL